MTKEQTRLIHIAQRQLEMNDRQYRMILKHVADCSSSSQLTNSSFEDVMALFEERGFRMPDKAADYFRNKVKLRGTFAGERASFKIQELIAGTKYSLAGLCDRFSHGRTREVTKLTGQESYGLIEMLKKVHERNEQADAAPEPSPPPRVQQPGLFPTIDLDAPIKTAPCHRHGGRPLEAAAAQEEFAEEPF